MRIDLPDTKIFLGETTFPVRWSDMDALGHVNNAVYFTYLEIVRVDWLRRLGVGVEASAQGPVVANAFCNFIVQLDHPCDVVAKAYAGAPGRASFDFFSTFERADRPGRVCAAGGATVVWFDFRAQKPVSRLKSRPMR